MHYFVACLPNRTAMLPYIKSMTECTNHRPWDTETPSHKISHDEYYEKRGTTDKTKHKPSMSQPRIWHTRITTDASVVVKIGNYQKVGYLSLLLKSKKNIATK